MQPNERLKSIRKELKLTQKELAEVLGIAPTTYAMIETGRRTLKKNYAKILRFQYNVNVDWLYEGEGEPFNISPINAKLIERFNQMSPQMQAYYLKMAEEILALERGIEQEKKG